MFDAHSASFRETNSHEEKIIYYTMRTYYVEISFLDRVYVQLYRVTYEPICDPGTYLICSVQIMLIHVVWGFPLF